MDREAWQAIVPGVAQCRTGLKHLCVHVCKEDSFSLHDQVTSISLPVTELFMEGFSIAGGQCSVGVGRKRVLPDLSG